MRKVICITILLFLVGVSYGKEIFSGVSYSFHYSWLTISKDKVRLEHSELRDYFLFDYNKESVMAIDFGCDGMLDIVHFGSRILPYDDPCFFEVENYLNRWKQEVFYSLIIDEWEGWKKRR